tara:strand:+ start:12122 stop:12433 length:312 start_codon:yes stop_codon:yes gene_type:complete
MTKTLIPNRIKLVKNRDKLLFEYEGGKYLILKSSYLRLKSPSAENKYNTSKDESSFKDVKLVNVEKVGNYAIRLVFNDDHRTGIYSWKYISEIGQEFQKSSNP